jgi:hypothetical protein
MPDIRSERVSKRAQLAAHQVVGVAVCVHPGLRRGPHPEPLGARPVRAADLEPCGRRQQLVQDEGLALRFGGRLGGGQVFDVGVREAWREGASTAVRAPRQLLLHDTTNEARVFIHSHPNAPGARGRRPPRRRRGWRWTAAPPARRRRPRTCRCPHYTGRARSVPLACWSLSQVWQPLQAFSRALVAASQSL